MSYSTGDGLLQTLSSLPPGRRFEASPRDLILLIEGGSLNTLVCDESYAKAYMLGLLVYEPLSRGKTVCVIDLDTFFTTYVEDYAERFPKPENLVVVRPRKAELNAAIANICSTASRDIGLIVLDSARTFYHLERETRAEAAAANRKLSLILALLQKTVMERSIPVVVTSLFTPKIGSKNEEISSKESYPGSRLLEKRSRVILLAWQRESFLEVKVARHPFDEGVDRRLFVKLV
ncbi:MAG: hypothetical protein HYU39_01775 [Thaumarchaeota archaeon]|nr:hypothetical protein [Nitrososphaerota archaeon]